MKITLALLFLSACLHEVSHVTGSHFSAEIPGLRRRVKRNKGVGTYIYRGRAGDSNSSSSTAVVPKVDPSAEICTAAGFYPTPGSGCKRFYRCVDFFHDGSSFWIFHFDCAPGTLFDVRISVCNHPYAVQCEDGESVDPDAKENLICDEDNRYRLHPSYCNKYYYCIRVEGKWETPVFTCPKNLIFDETKQICASNVDGLSPDCNLAPYPSPLPSEMESETNTTDEMAEETMEKPSNDTQPEESDPVISHPGTPEDFNDTAPEPDVSTDEATNSTTDSETGSFAITCQGDGRYKSHPVYCNNYYYCIRNEDDWSISIFTCPQGLIFDEANQRCAKTVDGVSPDCNRAPYPSPLPSELGSETNTTDEMAEETMEKPSNDTQPEEFDPIISQPGTSEGSNDTASQPDVPADEATNSTSSLEPEDTSSGFTITCQGDGRYRLHPLYCNKYFYCIHNEEDWSIPVLTCPESLIFDEANQKCAETAEGVSPDCNRAPYPSPLPSEMESETNTTAEMAEETTEKPSNDTQPDESDPVISQPGTAEDFNDTASQPDVPADEATNSTSSSEPEDTSGGFTITCQGDGRYRLHPLYCNKYFYCIHNEEDWSIPVLTCPEGLIFDETNQKCAETAEGVSPDCNRAPYPSPLPSEMESETNTTAEMAEETMEKPSNDTQPEESDPVISQPGTSEASNDTTSQPDVPTDEATNSTSSPESEDTSDSFTITCQGDGRYRIHPIYCNKYFFCIRNEEDWSIPVLTCPEGLIFDEANQKCAETAEGVSPDCDRAPFPSPLPSEVDSETNATAEMAEETMEKPSNDTQPEESDPVISQPGTSEASNDTASQPDVPTDEAINSTSNPEPEDTSSAFDIRCQADDRYRLDPVYCNKYYYCIRNEDDWRIPVITCPKGLIFDEANQKCAKTAEGVRPDCKRAPYPIPLQPRSMPITIVAEPGAPPTLEKRILAEQKPEAISDRKILDEEHAPETSPTLIPDELAFSTPTQPETPEKSVAEISQPETNENASNSAFECHAVGYYPFEGDCALFHRCVETFDSSLLDLIYKCPDGYGYSEADSRCVEKSVLPFCDQVLQPEHGGIENATPLVPKDLLWFFNN